MAIFRICPTKGPWPTPPWCVIQNVNSKFSYSEQSYLANTPSTNISIKNDFVFGIGMMDLWGKLCTSPFTCDNPKEDVDTSFQRLKQLNTNLVMVTDFYQIDRNKDFLEVNRGGARTISQQDMKLLIDKAHENNMKFMLMTNLYEKEHSREVLNNHDPEKQELNKLFDEWKIKILNQAKKGNYDYLVINPRDITFFFDKKEDNDYMNNKLVELIPEIRKVYSGKICLWGPSSWIEDFGDNYDCLIVDEDVKNIFRGISKLNNNIKLEDITKKWNDYLDTINYNPTTFVLILMPSYKKSLDNGWIEPVGAKYGAEYVKDYKIQALVYEGFFEAVTNHPKISGVISYGYWWNDNLYPNTLDIFRNDLSHSIRDKDAEAVFYKWANK